MADLPIDLEAGLAERLARIVDIEGKIPRALESLGPVGGRDVILVDAPAGIRAQQLRALDARLTVVESQGPTPFDAPDASSDAVVALWGPFVGHRADELAQAERLLRPGGRLLVVHDYGRDDVAGLRGDLPGHGAWSRRDGPFLGNGFKIRVVHAWWTFGSLDDGRDFLESVFGPAGRATAEGLTRPRLSYNVAVYHRTFGAEDQA